DLAQARKPSQESSRIGFVLVVDKTFDRGSNNGAGFPGVFLRQLLPQRSNRRACLRGEAALSGRPACLAASRRPESGSERGEAALHSHASPANSGFEGAARKRQCIRTGKRAKQHGTENTPGRIRERCHVKRNELPRSLTASAKQRRGVGPTVGKRD